MRSPDQCLVAEDPRDLSIAVVSQLLTDEQVSTIFDQIVAPLEQEEQFQQPEQPKEPQPTVLFNAANIPALKTIGEHAKAETDALFEQRMQTVREGETTSVPLDVDPLTAGNQAVEAKRRYGEDSHQYREKRDGLRTNSRRFLGEAIGTYGASYFEALEHVFDEGVDDYVAFGTATSDITRNGITPLAQAYEVPRRSLEHVETMINRSVGQMAMRLSGVYVEDIDSWSQEPIQAIELPAELQAAESISSIVISELPKEVKERYLEDKAKGIQRAYAGYCPQDDKFMIRSTRYSKDGTSRGVEQLALSGKHITHEVIRGFWVRQDVLSLEQAAGVSQDEAHGVVMLAAKDMGVLEVGKALDDIASEMSGENIFLGEVVPADHPKDYDAVPAEAISKRKQLEEAAEKLSDYVEQMVEDGVDRFVANGYYEVHAKSLMFAAVKHDVEMVAQTFGDATAHAVQASIELRVQGDHMGAAILERLAESKAPPLETCGAGSCGLVAVSTSTTEGAAAAAKGLKAEGGQLLKLPGKKCDMPKCKGKGLLFDKHGGKVCLSCDNSNKK
jgi:imidazoleglycerol phosphate dehydratase HisB